MTQLISRTAWGEKRGVILRRRCGNDQVSPLDQINAANVEDLKIVWQWKAQNFGERPDFNWEVTPLMAGGVLYFTAGTKRDVRAADAPTGIPMTYIVNDRHFVVVAAGATGMPAELLALALPYGQGEVSDGLGGLSYLPPRPRPTGTTGPSSPGGGAPVFAPRPPRPGGTQPSFEGPFWKNLASLLRG